ncbi:MAG: ABC transporter substrate-binding protein [Chloroflexi bacterium]|nr:ABC transporter substrate-binding protein [Chloroflexota bacterium]
MKKYIVLGLIVCAGWLTACAGEPTPAPLPLPPPPPPTKAPVATAVPTAAPTAASNEINVVMGYIPNVQFAPWYVAQSKGYFAEAGLRVKFNWGFEVDGVKLVGVNQADFAMLGGDQVLQAREKNIPLVYVANYYNGFPIVVVSLKEKKIEKAQDLVGKKIGLPAFWGATYTGWRALLYGANIKESDVKTQDVGFAQVAALSQGVVDAVAGYANNEPVQLRLQGKEVNVMRVADYSRLVGIGLVTSEKMIAEKPHVVRGIVAALMRGVQYSIDNPSDALAITIQNIPEAGGTNLRTTDAVLKATIDLWKSPHPGYVDPAAWAASYKFMKDAGFIKADFDVTKAYTNKFVP